MNSHLADSALRPMLERSVLVRRATIVLTVLTGGWIVACVHVLTEGHMVLGTDSYSAPWGLTVANIVHIIGISHVGIAVSAAVRLLGLARYRNVARLAEIVTLLALVMAVVNIALDVGRPDRFIVNTLVHGRWHAPMVWSATVITLYLLASSVYLYLSMRRDFLLLSMTEVPFRRAYRVLAMGYRDLEEERALHDRTLYWLALALVPIMVSVHSVYGLFFGLLTAKAGWYNPLQAPYFVLGAVVSGISALIVLAAILRRLYRWHDVIDNRTFRVLGSVLAFVVFLYLYFLGSEQLTAQYAARPAEKAASDALLRGDFGGIFWSTILIGLAGPLVMLLWQLLRSAPVRVELVALPAALINAAMLVKRVLLVVPAQAEPALPVPDVAAPYHPTFVEVVSTFGTYALGALLLLGLLKAIPLLEVTAQPTPKSRPGPLRGSASPFLVMAPVVVAVVLVAWGVATRDQDMAPLKWISGLGFLALMPLINCLASSRAFGRSGSGEPDETEEGRI